MRFVFLTALGVGGATVVGGIIGFFIKSTPKKFFDLTLSFAAGIMLAAAVWGLIIPSLGGESFGETAVTVIGIILGAFFVGCCERLAPKLRFVVGDADTDGCADGAIMLLLAMAIHNLPEGIAAGVSLGSGDAAGAIAVAGGIALQNIPEGMVIIPPMLAAGVSRLRAFLLALFTGAVEVFGTFLGYRSVTFFAGILPLSLAFAGGAMIYVIADEMMPTAKKQGKTGVYAFIFGTCAMILLGAALA